MTQSGYLEDRTHYFSVRVYYSDTDAGGVVYHSRYLDMAEHARTELLRLTGEHHAGSLSEARTGFVVQSLSITYKTPAFLDDLLTIQTKVLKSAVFSMVIEQVIMRDTTIVASMEMRVGHVSLDQGKPVPIPEIWRGM